MPQGLVIPAGLDPVIADLIAQVNQPDHQAWMNQVARVGACARPVHLRGFVRVRNASTGGVDYEFSSRDAPGGVIYVRCGNRRVAVCPSCAYLYQGDVYHLVRSGLEGGKGIPESVSTHPRVFATLTAPGFGAVHTHTVRTAGPVVCHPRRSPVCEHGCATACFARHGEEDELVGTPLCADCYDYRGAVVWQASVGVLWQRFITYLPRFLATVTGRARRDVVGQVRFSFVKIVEYQRRGLVHVHAVIRADGIPPDQEADDGQPQVIAPPEWVNAEILQRAVSAAGAAVRVNVPGGSGGSWVLGWGPQLDVRDVGVRAGQTSAQVAAYVAKYATKSTEVTGWDSSGRLGSPRAVHTAAMVAAAYGLAEVPELGALNLGRWVKELAYRGHVSSKSRRYSTTLGALRQVRADHRAAAGQTLRPGGVGLVVESAWELAGFGYTPGQSLLAADMAAHRAFSREAARDAIRDGDV